MSWYQETRKPGNHEIVKDLQMQKHLNPNNVYVTIDMYILTKNLNSEFHSFLVSWFPVSEFPGWMSWYQETRKPGNCERLQMQKHLNPNNVYVIIDMYTLTKI